MVARVRLQRDEQVARTEVRQEAGLRGAAERLEARGGSGSLDRGEVDVGGQVLAPDRHERIGMDPMAVVGPKGGAAIRA